MPSVEQIPANNLRIPEKIQRRLDEKRVDGMLIDFDLDAVGALTVSRRNGTLWVVDGQHRAEALKKSGNGSVPVQCIVYDGMDEQHEAKLFRLLNNTKRLGPIDLFKVRVVEGDPIASDIEKILNEKGWKVRVGPDAGCFGAIAAFERIYRADRVAAVDTITVLTGAFGRHPSAVHGALVSGIGNVLVEYGENVQVNSLATRLSKHEAIDLRARAHALAKIRGVTIANGVAELVVDEYNKSRQPSTMLPHWTSR